MLSKIKNITKYLYLKIIEVISSLVKLFIRKINPRLLVFGGNNFTGNTKYLFLFMNNYLKNQYTIIWISGNKDLVNELKYQGYNAKYKFSLKSVVLLLKARCIFITHGFNDILPVNLDNNTKLVYLAHGIPFKRPNFDAKNFNTIFKSKYDIKMIEKLFKRMDYHISCADNFNKILANAYKMSEEKVKTTGYPRNDIFFVKDIEYISNLKNKFGIPFTKKIVLYAPTFREHRIIRFPLSSKEIRELDKFLEESNSLLLVKPHINENIIEFNTINNAKVISQEIDIQELLLISDILITDYSSVFLDYILTDRPIIFYAYDLDYFRTTRGEFYYKYEDFIPGPLALKGKDLINQLQIVFNYNSYSKKIKEIKDFSHQYQDGNSCKRVCELLGLHIDSEII